ncbi:MAG: hypothetical protein GXO39_09090 [Thermotogae bacterium]|nr:hypothetical protein [Thermotogota bacterium]
MLLALLSIPLLYEDFESSTFPPTRWDSTYTNYYIRWQRRTSGVIFGSGSAGIITGKSSYTDTGTATLITPPVEYVSLDSLVFYYKFPGTQPPFAEAGDTIFLDYSLDGGTTWITIWFIDSANAIINAPVRISLPLSSLSGPDTLLLRWRFVDQSTSTISQNRYFLVDSVVIFGTPIGNAPPIVTLVALDPLFPDTNVDVTVSFTATDSDGSIAAAYVLYSFDGSTYNVIPATPAAGDTFVATIPARGSYGKVYYGAAAIDDVGDTSASTLAYYIAGFLRVHEVRTLGLGDTAQTKVVIVGEIGSAIYAQDSTEPVSGVSSGIVIYSSSVASAVDTGYVILIRGELTEYRNLFEISPAHAFQVVDSGPVYPPAYISTAEMNESYEGMLVAIRGFTWVAYPGTFAANTNYDIQDGSGTGVLRVSSATDLDGNPAPDGILEVWGVLGQYNTTYQLYPRYINDFSPYLETISITPNPPVSGSLAIVSARVYDFDGLGPITLHYSTDTTSGYTTVTADSITTDSIAYFTIASVPSGDTLYLKVEAHDSRSRITFSFLQRFPIDVGVTVSERPSEGEYINVRTIAGGLFLEWNLSTGKLLRIYGPSGRLYKIVEISGKGSRRISLPRGIFFLKNDREVEKVVIR